MTDQEALLALIGDKTRVIAKVGTYVGVSGSRALVDMGDERFAAVFTCPYVPEINEPVHVWSVDGAWFLVGPTTGKPGAGVAGTAAASQVPVTFDGFGTFTMPYLGSAPASGNTVAVQWTNRGPVCLGAFSLQPAAPTPPTPPGGGGTTIRTAEFRAIDAGSTDRGSPRWWQAQPWASNTTYGAWFYGTQIKDTIPAGAVFVSLEFYVNRVQDSGGDPLFALHNGTFKSPSSIPTFGSTAAWDPPNGWQTPADASGWFAALKSGGSQNGVGLNQGGYNKFASLAQDGLSGALRIKWK